MASQAHEVGESAAGDGELPELDLVWRCADCGYQRMSADRPERCAACGAGADHLIGRTAIAWRFLLRQEAS